MFRAALISLFITSTALATTWTVDDDGKADFDNIQAAVDAASDGDEIIVMPGTYTSTQDEHVVNMLGKALTLRSSDPSDTDVVAATIIDGEGARRGIMCDTQETSKTVIEGFTITNGSVYLGGGMLNDDSSPSLTNCTFTGNTSHSGGGMYNSNNSNPTLINCTFTSNTTIGEAPAGYGGGMYNSSNSSPTLTDCAFTSNTSIGGGGGMFNDNMCNPTLTDCTFTGNTAQGGGGMLNYDNCNPTLIDCIFTSNTVTLFGGGMYTHNLCNVTLDDCTFTGNIAGFFGGGMCLPWNTDDGIITLTDTTVCGNTPDQVDGYWTNGGGNAIAGDCACTSDINVDGNINIHDLLSLIADWGSCSRHCVGDLNVDGNVNVHDLLILISNWGPCE
jgi:pectin methylesterase-like acyl-CoA thioesterase